MKMEHTRYNFAQLCAHSESYFTCMSALCFQNVACISLTTHTPYSDPKHVTSLHDVRMSKCSLESYYPLNLFLKALYVASKQKPKPDQCLLTAVLKLHTPLQGPSFEGIHVDLSQMFRTATEAQI